MKIKDNGSLNMSVDERSILQMSSDHDEMIGRVKATLAYLDLIEKSKEYIRHEDLARQVQAMLGVHLDMGDLEEPQPKEQPEELGKEDIDDGYAE